MAQQGIITNYGADHTDNGLTNGFSLAYVYVFGFLLDQGTSFNAILEMVIF